MKFKTIQVFKQNKQLHKLETFCTKNRVCPCFPFSKQIQTIFIALPEEDIKRDFINVDMI